MNWRNQHGVTLVELMIAMVIGLILMGAVASVYFASRDTYRTSEIVARMQENGRTALHLIASDLAMAGFMGNNTNPELIENAEGTPAPLPPLSGAAPATQDCADRWYIDTSALLLAGNNAAPVHEGTSFSSTCLLNKGLQPGTDVIAVKRAASGAIPDSETGSSAHSAWTLLRTDLVRGAFFIGGGTIPPGMNAVTTNRRWLSHVYFIAPDATSGIPELRRLTLGSGPNLYNRELVPGVQDLQIQYGVDNDGNGSPDQFVEPGMEGNANVVAARVWLLMRSDVAEPDHDDSANTYEYANKAYTPGDGGDGTETANEPTQHRRLLMSTTVALRNNWN